MGLSSTIDVLLQQQTLESEQLALTSARHDAYVAGAALLAAMGGYRSKTWSAASPFTSRPDRSTG